MAQSLFNQTEESDVWTLIGNILSFMRYISSKKSGSAILKQSSEVKQSVRIKESPEVKNEHYWFKTFSA